MSAPISRGRVARRVHLTWRRARHRYGPPLAWAATMRLLYLAAVAAGAAAAPNGVGAGARFAAEGVVGRIAAVLVRWDGQLYLDIAREGYVSPPLHLRAAFFPLLPACIHQLHALTGVAPHTCGLVLTNLCDVFAACLVWRLAVARVGRRRARHVLAVWSLFPGRLFGLVLGTEGPLAACSVGAFVAAGAGRPALAWLAAACAGATRAPGAFVGLALAVQVLTDGHVAAMHPNPRPRGLQRAVLLGRSLLGASAYALAAVVGPSTFAAHLYQVVGRPWAFAEVQSAWRRAPAWPWATLVHSAEPYDHVACWLGLAGIVLSLRRGAPVRAGERFLLAASVVLPSCTGRLMSMQRFVGVVFPLALLGGVLMQRRWPRRIYWAYALGVGVVLGVKLGLGHKVV